MSWRLPTTGVIEGPEDVDNNYSPATAEPDDAVTSVLAHPGVPGELLAPIPVSSSEAEFAQVQREVKLITAARQGLPVFVRDAAQSVPRTITWGVLLDH